MSGPVYVPILVGKLGEFEALKTLPDEQRALLRPIFDLAPIALEKDASDPIEELIKRVGRAFSNGGAAAVDLLGLDGCTASGTHPVDYLLTRAVWGAAAVRLAVRTDASPSYIAAVAEHHHRGDGICLRARVLELGEPGALADRVTQLLKLFGLPPSKVHLCFDCGRITDWTRRPDLVLADHLHAHDNLDEFSLVSVASTNVPPNDKLSREERPRRVQRREWTMWQRLSREGFQVAFGDYGVTGPRPTELAKGRPAPHLRYTTRSALLIWRGQRADLVTEEDRDLPTSFRDLCEELIEHDDFALDDFSAGDRVLANIAAGQHRSKAGKPSDGNTSQWIEWATNHHVAHVMSQLGS